jgi:acetyltransferase-like isoleucine patch superfamily enzyme
MNLNNKMFYPLAPGKKIENDWCNFPVPTNMIVGDNTVIDSSSCFKSFFSTLPTGLRIGKNVTIENSNLATEPNGYIEIGENSYLSGVSVVAFEKIMIGNYVFLGWGVTIVDTDFHPADAAARLADTIAISPVGDRSKRPAFPSKPVIIEDDVWVGFNATILKGVTIGKGSIIQPGAVVSKSVPPGCIAEGNPAGFKPIQHED